MNNFGEQLDEQRIVFLGHQILLQSCKRLSIQRDYLLTANLRILDEMQEKLKQVKMKNRIHDQNSLLPDLKEKRL